MKKLIFIILLLMFFVVIIYWNQGFLLSKMPFGNFSSVGSIEDEGFIGPIGGEGGFALLNLPSCQKTNNLYIDQGPRIKYVLVNDDNLIRLPNFLYKTVKVSGKVKVETKTLKSPEIVCIKAPCQATMITRTMFLEKIENDNNQSLSSCQRIYLDNLSKGFKK